MESHTITEEVPATSQDREASTQNVQQIRKTLKTNDSIRYKVQNADEWTKQQCYVELERQLVKINTGTTYKMISAKKRKV